MAAEHVILVAGATGRQGGAAARHLIKSGWKVRALTRNPDSKKAQALEKAGAELVKGNLDQPETLRQALQSVYGVFSVQNPWISGLKKETEQGIRIAELAAEAGVKHFVYSSAGPGTADTGVPHFNSKLPVEAKVQEIGIPYTILRPAGFMELMSDKDFVPPLVAWNVTGKMLGDEFPVSWIACDDIGAITAKVFDNPEGFGNREIPIAGDIRSIGECKRIYKSLFGKSPFSIPAPVWLFKLMQKDLYLMYEWMKGEEYTHEVLAETQQIHPDVMDVEVWMRKYLK